MDITDNKSLNHNLIIKYYNKDLFNTDLNLYKNIGFKVYKFDADMWYTIEDLYSDMHEKFQFPSYFGRNWGAVDDLITDIDKGKNGKALISIENYDAWYNTDKESAQILLEVLFDASYHRENGDSFVSLIQLNNQRIVFKKYKEHEVELNKTESILEI